MDRATKKQINDWIKDFALLGKRLNKLNKEVQRQDFSQGQRQLEIINNSFKRDWFSSVKRLFITVK